MNPLRKGTDLLLKAAAKLNGDFELIIHSQRDLFEFYKDDKSILECLHALENDKKLNIITKTVSSPGLYHLGNVYVYPCRLDGLGLTVPEAISCGLPTIIPDAEPMREFISPACSVVAIDRFYCRKDGYYWPQQLCDINDLAKQMQRYIGINDLAEKMAIARAHAVEHLNWQKNSAQLHQYIQASNVTPLTPALAKVHQNFTHYGFRKILTKIEKYKAFFMPFFYFYSKLKK